MHDVESLGRTAFLISELRERVPRLFDDPYAHLFSTPQTRAALAGVDLLGPLFLTWMRVRTRWFDDVLQRELERGVRQVQILGAGMDCRALRFARGGVTYFELDARSVLAFKAERLAQAGHPHGAVAVGGDYLAPGLLDRLLAHGFDRQRPTLVLWEGNTYYLAPEEMRELLRLLAGAITDLRVAFDYFGRPVIEERSPLPMMNRYAALVRGLGAPWRCGIDPTDLPELARQANLHPAENVSFGELVNRLLPDLDLGPGAAAEYGMCLLARLQA